MTRAKFWAIFGTSVRFHIRNAYRKWTGKRKSALLKSRASIGSGHVAGASASDNAVCPETRGVHPEPRGEAFAREFDARLAGRVSVLTDFSPQAPRVVAEAYRAVLGLPESACSDAEAIDRLLIPARNTYS